MGDVLAEDMSLKFNSTISKKELFGIIEYLSEIVSIFFFFLAFEIVMCCVLIVSIDILIFFSTRYNFAAIKYVYNILICIV